MNNPDKIRRLLDHLQEHEDRGVTFAEDTRTITLFAWGHMRLDVPVSFEVTQGVERGLMDLAAEDHVNLFPDRTPSEAALSLFLVHLEESLLTRPAGVNYISVYPSKRQAKQARGRAGRPEGNWSAFSPASGDVFAPRQDRGK